VGLDEAHAAHVGGEVVDRARALGGGAAGLEQGEVAHLVLDARGLLVPLVERLDVDGADLGMAALLQDADQMAADEATGAGDDHEIILGHELPFAPREGVYLAFQWLAMPVVVLQGYTRGGRSRVAARLRDRRSAVKLPSRFATDEFAILMKKDVPTRKTPLYQSHSRYL
jgi:hypothetical protein